MKQNSLFHSLNLKGYTPHYFILKCMLVFFIFFSWGNLSSQTLLKDVQYQFEKITPSSGELISRFLPRVDLRNFNGQADADTADYESTQDIRRLALLNKYGIDGFRLADSINKSRQQYWLERRVLPLGVSDFKYKVINPALANTGKVSRDGDSVFQIDLGGFHGEMYHDMYALSAYSPVERVRTDMDSIVLDSQLVLSSFDNWKDLKWSLLIHGKKYSLEWNKPTFIDWEGLPIDVDIRIQTEIDKTDDRMDFMENPWMLPTGIFRISGVFKVILNIEIKEIPDLIAVKDLSVHYSVDTSNHLQKAMYTVHKGFEKDGKIHRCIQKPLVIVEGIDFGYPNYPHGFPGQKYGQNGYVDLLKGKTWNYTSQLWEDWASIQAAPAVIDRLRNRGYDIIYIDFYDGAQNMNYNAEILINVIQEIQDKMCGTELHVVGMSMGGVVAKRALALMEFRGIAHCVKSLTGFDSPFGGANFPLGLQNTVHYFSGSVSECDEILNRVVRRGATKQLLINHENSTFRYNILRKQWLREDTIYQEFPKKPWMFGIANGSSRGKSSRMKYDKFTDLEPGLMMMRLKLGFKLYLGLVRNHVLDIYAENYYDKKNEAYYNGRLFGYKEFYSDENNAMWDHVAGSYVNNFGFFDDLGKKRLLTTAYLTKQSCFVPTFSALGITSRRFGINAIEEQAFSIHEGVLSNKITNGFQTFFDRLYVPKENQPHIFLDTSKGGNVDWLIKQIESVSDGIQPEFVSDAYNLRSPHIRTIKELRVNGNGFFEVNGVGGYPSWTATDSIIASSAERRSYYAGDCSSQQIHLTDSASFFIGKHHQPTDLIVGGNTEFVADDFSELRVVKSNNTLRLMPGSVLWLKGNSMLRIESGAQLIVEHGASLRFSDKAKLVLEGSESLLHVKGLLKLDSGYVFKPLPDRFGEVGLLKFTNMGYGFGQARISYGKNCSFILKGNGKNANRNLQLEGRFGFTEEEVGHSLKRFIISQSKVCFGPLSNLKIEGNVSLTESSVEAVEWDKGYCGSIYYRGDNGEFSDVSFNRLDTALSINRKTFDGTQEVDQLSFYQCKLGFQGIQLELFMEDCEFEGCKTGVDLVGVRNETLLRDCRFDINHIGINVSNRSEKDGKLLLQRNEIYENEIGLNTDKVYSTLFCNRFGGNSKAIKSCKTVVYMDGQKRRRSKWLNKYVGGGLNVFTQNKITSVELDQAEIFADGGNVFHQSMSLYAGEPFISGDFRVNESKSYYNYDKGRIDIGKNRFYPLSLNFSSDTLNDYFIQLTRNKGIQKLKATGRFMKYYEGAACEFKAKTGDVMHKRYNNLDEEERTSIDKPLVIGLSNALLFKKSEMKVYVFNSVGTLIKTVQIVRAGEELKVPPGIYFVRAEWNGKQETQKVWVGH